MSRIARTMCTILLLVSIGQSIPPSLGIAGNLSPNGSTLSSNDSPIPRVVCTDPPANQVRPTDCGHIIDEFRAGPYAAVKQVFISSSPFPTPGQIQVPIVWVYNRCYISLRPFGPQKKDMFSFDDVADVASRVLGQCAQRTGAHVYGGWSQVGNANSFGIYMYAK